MRADGAQLGEITKLVDAGAIRPEIDAVFDFDAIPAAIERVKSGRSRGKAAIRVAADLTPAPSVT